MSEQKPKAKTKAELLAEKMAANKVGKAAFEAGKKPIVDTNVPVTEEVKEEPVKVEEVKQPAVEEQPVAPVTEPAEKTADTEEEPASSILKDLFPKEKKSKSSTGTKGFYIDGDVHDELVRLAKIEGKSKSQVLNRILRRVLFNE